MLSTSLAELVEQAHALESENRTLRLQVKRLEGRVRQLERQEQASGPDPSSVLGLEQGATAEQVQEAFRRLARDHHPDFGGDPSRFRQLVEARDALLPT